MTTVSAVATKVRIATAASAIVAAATLVPAAVAYASPAAPLPQQTGLGSTLAGLGSTLLPQANVTVTPCDPAVDVCIPGIGGIGGIGDPIRTPIIIGNPPFVWIGSPANPNFQPLIGIVFPNVFGLNHETCVFGAAVHLSPAYPQGTGRGFAGFGLGC
jgi:hypothetical protein